jgi:hypothetical protein
MTGPRVRYGPSTGQQTLALRGRRKLGTRYPSINEVVLTMRGSGLVLRRVSEHGPDLAPHPPKEVGAILDLPKQFPIAPIDIPAPLSIANITGARAVGDQSGGEA